MKFFKLGVCFLATMTIAMIGTADNRDHGEANSRKSKHSIQQDSSSDGKLDSAMKKLDEWMADLEERLPKEIDKSVEKLLASLEKPADLSTKLFDILAQSEQQFEPDEKTVFGQELGKFSVEDRRKLVIAWTSKLQELLRKRAVTISEKLAQTGDPKAKELSEVLRKLSQAHSQAYEEYKKEIKTSNDPKLFCFACDGHIGDFNYHEDMDRQIKEALSAWSSSAGSSGNNISPVEGKSPTEASAGEKKTKMTPPGQGSVSKYLATLEGKAPNPYVYPKPENMAPVLGLTSPDNFSYLKWKGEGKHYVEGPKGNEYGVEVNWDFIKSQSPDEQKRVLAIFDEIIKFDTPGPFKVVNGKPDEKGNIPKNGKDGYCLWCNLKHYHPSVVELEKLRTSVQSQRNK